MQMFTPKFMNTFNKMISITFKDKILRHSDTVKYLGYLISSKKKNRSIILCEEPEIKLRIRELYMRSNMIRCYFSKCSREVKKLLFNTYFSTIYCSSLWEINVKKHDHLMIAYNDALRIIFGLHRWCSASAAFVKERIGNLTFVRRTAVFSLRSRIENTDNVILKAIYSALFKDGHVCKLANIWNVLLTPVTH